MAFSQKLAIMSFYGKYVEATQTGLAQPKK